MEKPFFTYACPNCRIETNAALIAAALPDEVLIAEAARRSGRRQTPHAGPGRPSLYPCPGCSTPMAAAELGSHRVGCVQRRLENLRQQNFIIHLSPSDPDPYPDLRIHDVSLDKVTFHRLSSGSFNPTIELEKVAEIAIDNPHPGRTIANIRLFGRLTLDQGLVWRFAPSRPVGRPRQPANPA